MLAQETIRRKRDGHVLDAAQIADFVAGLVDGRWSDSQAAALAMAVVCRGMDAAETASLTRAMTHSGTVLDWRDAGLRGPILDKHSTGGVGDKVSLILAPLVAACGGVVPMVSGRGLGHTGGTLDKLEALHGYDIAPAPERLRQVLREAGCAIVGAHETLAPADRRLYAIRDVTATVESVALITASILSKKIAAGLQGLVMDVKVGNGAFAADLTSARALATSLVTVAAQAGLPTVASLTAMDQPLGWTAGNALEMQEAIDLLTARAREPRLLELTCHLSARLLVQGGLAPTVMQARDRLQRALDSGAAAECLARMVRGLGGPPDVLREARLPRAPAQADVAAPCAGVIAAIDTRALGLLVVELGGGRSRPGDTIDPAVGLSALRPIGARVDVGEPLARVHAADAQALARATQLAVAAFTVQPFELPAPTPLPLVIECLPADTEGPAP